MYLNNENITQWSNPMLYMVIDPPQTYMRETRSGFINPSLSSTWSNMSGGSKESYVKSHVHRRALLPTECIVCALGDRAWESQRIHDRISSCCRGLMLWPGVSATNLLGRFIVLLLPEEKLEYRIVWDIVYYYKDWVSSNQVATQGVVRSPPPSLQ